MKKYIEFKLVRKLPKTAIYAVISKSDGAILGHIHWYASWRQYTFSPTIEMETEWSRGCLQEIQDFIDKLMAARKPNIKLLMLEEDKKDGKI